MVLLHGLCEDRAVWSDVAATLAPWGRLYAVDLPGFGASPLPASPEMGLYARAVLDILEAEGVRTCVLVGHSLGGYVALEFAARYGTHLAGLVLVHSHPFADSPERLQDRLRSIAAIESGRKDLFVRQLFGNLFAPTFAEAHPEVVESAIHIGLRQSEAGIIAALKTIMGRSEHTQTLCQCPCPVMAILGEQDRLIPWELTKKAVECASAPTVHLLPEVGHMGMLEAPDLVAEKLRDFWLNRIAASAISH